MLRVRRRWPRTLSLFLYTAAMAGMIMPGQEVLAASTRLTVRGLMMNSARAGETTDYTLSFRFTSPQPVGSIELDFCTNPIPYLPCYTPAGMDITGATLSAQSGETGFSITTHSTQRVVLSRTPSTITPGLESSYVFSGIKNPTNIDEFAIRIQIYNQPGAAGDKGDFGSVRGAVSHEIYIETQVPPMLIFCLAEKVELECTGSNKVYSTKLGELTPDAPLVATSEMAVGTNATAGFAIIVDGIPPAAGTNVIDAMSSPGPSQPGTNQFGINLVANAVPSIGEDPQGIWNNAIPTAGYGTPNQFMFRSGDVVALSPDVSLMRKFTVSYMVNSKASLRPGIYATTITFIASGRF